MLIYTNQHTIQLCEQTHLAKCTSTYSIFRLLTYTHTPCIHIHSLSRIKASEEKSKANLVSQIYIKVKMLTGMEKLWESSFSRRGMLISTLGWSILFRLQWGIPHLAIQGQFLIIILIKMIHAYLKLFPYYYCYKAKPSSASF